MKKASFREDWALSTISWYAVFVWFGASLFSQVAYLAINGVPYDANLLVTAAGPFAWVLIGMEVIVWAFVAIFITGKVTNRLNVNANEIVPVDVFSPQT
tara:strand:+ start:880 stop:1176 length:297 start_codon:yes stop_codon:yes gene_type:complete